MLLLFCLTFFIVVSKDVWRGLPGDSVLDGVGRLIRLVGLVYSERGGDLDAGLFGLCGPYCALVVVGWTS